MRALGLEIPARDHLRRVRRAHKMASPTRNRVGHNQGVTHNLQVLSYNKQIICDKDMLLLLGYAHMNILQVAKRIGGLLTIFHTWRPIM